MGTYNFTREPNSTDSVDIMPWEDDETGEMVRDYERMDIEQLATANDSFDYVEVGKTYGEKNDLDTIFVVFDKGEEEPLGLITFEIGYYEGVRVHFTPTEYVNDLRELIEDYNLEEFVIEEVTGVKDIDFEQLEELVGYYQEERLNEIMQTWADGLDTSENFFN